MQHLVEVENLSKHFPIRNALGMRTGELRAVDRVSLGVRRGETLALVGESGSGKTTLGRCMLLMEQPTDGTVHYDGTDLTALSARDRREHLRRMQVIFQDPFSSLNPGRTALQQVMEPIELLLPDEDAESLAREALERVGVTGSLVERYPRAFSGGQRQRIGIARAIAVRPSFVMCDEPVSALDLAVQAQVLDLLDELQQQLGLSYLFISHDLSVVRAIADRVAVMYRGRIVELADTEMIFDDARHPYTRKLLLAAPVPDPEAARRATRERRERPVEAIAPDPEAELVEVSPGHQVALRAED